MASLDRVKRDIADIAGRRKNVTASEIERIVDQLERLGYEVRRRTTPHNRLYTVNGQKFGICTHNRGSKEIKSVYVDEFAAAMAELELYEG